MKKRKTDTELKQHKQIAIEKIQNLIDTMSEIDIEKADKFCYWLEDYSSFLYYEKDFVPQKLKRYKPKTKARKSLLLFFILY